MTALALRTAVLTRTGLALGGCAALALAALPAVGAPKYSNKVRSACADDYLQFCPQYDEGSPKLKACMRSQGKRLSPNCIRALVDAGTIPRSALRR
jgi:hypothetical protein